MEANRAAITDKGKVVWPIAPGETLPAGTVKVAAEGDRHWREPRPEELKRRRPDA